jgi:hypothetical protein
LVYRCRSATVVQPGRPFGPGLVRTAWRLWSVPRIPRVRRFSKGAVAHGVNQE